MESDEVPEVVKEAFANPNFSWKFPIYPEDRTTTKRSFHTLFNYIADEIEFWRTATLGEANNIPKHFITIQNDLNFAIAHKDHPGQLKQGLLNAHNKLLQKNLWNIHSRTAIGQAIGEAAKQDAERSDGLIDGFFRFRVMHNRLQNEQYVRGVVAGLRLRPDTDKLFKTERDALIVSLESTKDRYEKIIQEAEQKFETLSDTHSKASDDFRAELTEWKKKTTGSVESFITEQQQELTNLKEKYQEYLRFKGPATYWEKSAAEYRARGKLWMWLAACSSVAFMISLFIVLRLSPDAIFAVQDFLSVSAWKGTIIFALYASVGVYVIRLFVKLSISAYHLNRDAKERVQLTHLYLSLSDSTEVSEKDRATVLQALFSRADTGLLKGDSTPAMPDSLAGIIARLGGGQ